MIRSSLFFSEPFAVKHSMRVVYIFDDQNHRKRHFLHKYCCVEVFALLLRVSVVVVVV